MDLLALILLSISVHRNAMVESLRQMYEEASSMDESSLFPLPLGLFEHIDDLDRNNPETYQFKMIEDCNYRTDNVLRRVSALEVSNIQLYA